MDPAVADAERAFPVGLVVTEREARGSRSADGMLPTLTRGDLCSGDGGGVSLLLFLLRNIIVERSRYRVFTL